MKTLIAIMLAFGSLLAVPDHSYAQSTVSPTTHLSRRELKRLEQGAKTSAQFTVLAGYYRQREREFSAKAADQKIEWERRSQNVTGPSAKPPRPVDSARNLYEYYQYEADQAAKLAAQYEKSAQAHGSPDGAAV
jgi:hypothetical protein